MRRSSSSSSARTSMGFLFHVYHAQAVGQKPETFSWALWSEGLATYVSRRLR